MKLKDPYIYPPTGWVYTDYDTNVEIKGYSLNDLGEKVNKFRLDNNLSKLENIEQMIQDQLCDKLGVSYCSEKGLGDIVHEIAQPIAKVIDKVAGTNVQGCGGCARRRASLNR